MKNDLGSRFRGLTADLGSRFRRLAGKSKTTPEVVFGCPICFGVEQNATVEAAQAAVVVLVAITIVVVGVFVRFVAGLLKRESRQSGEPEC